MRMKENSPIWARFKPTMTESLRGYFMICPTPTTIRALTAIIATTSSATHPICP